MSFWKKVWNGVKSIGKAFGDLLTGNLNGMMKNLTDGLTDMLAPAIHAFKFAKAVVTGDEEGMKEAAKGLTMELGGAEVFAAFKGCKCLFKGDFGGAFASALEAGLGETSLGSKMQTCMDLKAAHDKDGMEGLGKAAVFASPAGNQARRAVDIHAGVEEGGVSGGVFAGLKTTAVGHRVDGVATVTTGFVEGGLDGGADAGLEVTSGYGRSVFGHQADRYTDFRSNVAEDGGVGMVTTFANERYENSQFKAKAEDATNFSPMGYASDLVSRKQDDFSDKVTARFERPDVTVSATDDHATASFWHKVNTPFDKIDGMFTAAETKINMFFDAPFLKLESKISGIEDKALSMFQAPERMFRAKLINPVDDATYRFDDKVESTALKVEAPISNAAGRVDAKVTSTLDTVFKPVDKASTAFYNAVNDPISRFGKRSDRTRGTTSTSSTGFAQGNGRSDGQNTGPADQAEPGTAPAATRTDLNLPLISDAHLRAIVKKNSEDMPTGMAWN